MGVGDALDIYDRVKEYELQKRLEEQAKSENLVDGIFMLLIVLTVVFFIVRAVIKNNKAKKAAKIAKTVVPMSSSQPQQGLGVMQGVVNTNQYGLVAVGLLKVKSIVQASSYREIVCNFHNNEISLDFNLTDVGEYKWLNDGDEVKVHLAKDQFKYYVSRFDM